jgi:hypothetical protein
LRKVGFVGRCRDLVSRRVAGRVGGRVISLVAPARARRDQELRVAVDARAGERSLFPQSRFVLSIAPVTGQPTQKKLIFSPRLTDRTYTVKSKASLLSGSYLPLTNPSAPTDNGQERTIIDLSASGAAKFYQVEISKP